MVNGTALESYGTLVNNGIIDLFAAGPTNFHGVFINNGSVRNGANMVISGTDVILKVLPLPFPLGIHIYNLQVNPSLAPANWVDSGATQISFGGQLLTFTDVGGATNRPGRFYRVRKQL